MTTEAADPTTDERSFAPETSSVRAARRFVRDRVSRILGVDGVRSELLGDVELAVSELVTNAVEYGRSEPVRVRVTARASSVVVSVASARAADAIGDPSTWSGPLPAVRTGRGLAIVRAITDEVAVDADDSTVTVHCTFRVA
jgi:anti-sigma regulatory factor (Ser/Thr protein kinase)